MEFLKTAHGKNIVFLINEKVLDDFLMEKIVQNFNFSTKKIGFDMKNVETINSELFLKYLAKNKIKLFNLQNETLVYLSIVLKKGFLKSYLNYKDFSQNKRQFLKRRFSIC